MKFLHPHLPDYCPNPIPVHLIITCLQPILIKHISTHPQFATDAATDVKY